MSRHVRVIGSVTLALVAMAAVAADPRTSYLRERGQVVGPHAAALDSVVPGASGICFVEVTRLRDEDDRPGDGDFVQVVELKVLRGTGLTTGGFALLREPGGFVDLDAEEQPVAGPSPARFTLLADGMRLGARYWIVTASPSDPRYPQGLAGVWAEDSTSFASLFESAIADDAYAWHPAYWESGWTFGWNEPSDTGATRVRVWRSGRLLWDRHLSGRLAPNAYIGWGGWMAKDLGDRRPMGIPDSSLVLIAAVNAQLPRDNRFGLPEGRVLIHDYRDLWSGRLIAARAETMPTLTCMQTYDRRGRLAFERVNEHVRVGGMSVGANDDRWLRQVERTFDPVGGRVLHEDVMRYGVLPGGHANSWIPVDRDSAYLAAPLKRAYTLAGK